MSNVVRISVHAFHESVSDKMCLKKQDFSTAIVVGVNASGCTGEGSYKLLR